jgi:hypothetical protein
MKPKYVKRGVLRLYTNLMRDMYSIKEYDSAGAGSLSGFQKLHMSIDL